MKLIGKNYSFGGCHMQYEHESVSTRTNMKFAIYLPPHVDVGITVPVLYWLSGLTCNQENFMQKAGAQRIASDLGMAIVAPDTSPRGDDVADDAAYDLGQGAGFYVNATEEPWAKNYNMYDYVVYELVELVEKNFPVSNVRAISGHSMGGHGSLVAALRNPGFYCSASAFAPICNPVNSPWGAKAFRNYLGENPSAWRKYDASCLLQDMFLENKNFNQDLVTPILIEQGEGDEWLEQQLFVADFMKVIAKADYPTKFFSRPDYDHSYYFVSSFIENALRFHADHMGPHF